MTTPMPRKVRIGYADYAVASSREHDGDLIENGLAGASNGNLLKILVRSDLPALTKAETLLHEVIHQALYMAGKEIPQETEEPIVRALSMQLFAVFRANPKLVAFLLQE